MSEARLRSVGPSVGLVYAYVCRWVVGGSGEGAWRCPGKAFFGGAEVVGVCRGLLEVCPLYTELPGPAGAGGAWGGLAYRWQG